MMDVITKLLKYFKSPVRAFNDSGERIESMRFSVPALRVGVLEYGAGQLQTGNAALEGKAVRLYYPPEAVSDEKFLKSLETAPVVVGGHDSTTNEQNKKIDGWAHNVFFDAAAKAAMIAGVVKGAKEVAYIKGNLGSAGFGASAFVDIYNLKVENGMTPDGQAYDAVAGELRATHVALAPHVRDPENKIRVTNAVCINTDGVVEVENAEALDKNGKPLKVGDVVQHDRFGKGKVTSVDTKTYSVPHVSIMCEDGKFKGEKIYRLAAEFVKNSRGELLNIKEYSMDPKELAALVKNAVDEAIAEKNSDDRMGAMEETLKAHGDALNEINEKLTPKAEGENGEAFEGKETAEEEKKEAATLENAKPSQEMVKAFSTALNVDFGAKTPSFATLAALAGISESDPAARIAAVNAKFGEIVQNAPKEKEAAAQNAAGEVF
ncbi:MAG: DUF2213 domain-containing protein [Candidatus Omnitrophica bacterium]|jgi:hypothetical protein|nr:DUF2213 domain-containing protein [Candidatus Omnitrophota bacterium]